MTIGRQWAWKPNDIVKPAKHSLQILIRTAGGDGNLLFNVGPRPDGLIEPEQIAILKEMGAWLAIYGESIYGTRGGPFKPADWGVSTRKENKIYLHLLNWAEGVPELSVPDIGNMLIKSSVLGGNDLAFKKDNNEIVIDLGAVSWNSVNTIIELEFDGNVMDIVPVEVKSNSKSYGKPVTVSSKFRRHWAEGLIVNGDWSAQYWNPAEGDDEPWVEIDLGSVQRVKNVAIYERDENIKAFDLQYYTKGKWQSFYQGKGIGPELNLSFPERELDKIRFVIKEFDGVPGIYEIVVN